MQLLRVDLVADGCLAHVVFRWGQIVEGGTASSVLPSVTPERSLERDWLEELLPWIQCVHGQGLGKTVTQGAIAQFLQCSKPALPESWKVGRVSWNGK